MNYLPPRIFKTRDGKLRTSFWAVLAVALGVIIALVIAAHR